MKELKEVLRGTELGEFIEKYNEDYIRKLEVREVFHNDLLCNEIVVKEKKDDCK